MTSLDQVSVCLSFFLSVCLSYATAHLSVCPFIICIYYLSAYLSFYHIHPSLFHLSIHPSIYLSVYPSVFLSVSPLSRFLLFLLSLFHQKLQSKLCQANKSYMHFQFHFILIKKILLHFIFIAGFFNSHLGFKGILSSFLNATQPRQ